MVLRLVSIVLVLVVSFAAAEASESSAVERVLVDVNVLDPSGESFLMGHDVVLVDGKIRSIDPTSNPGTGLFAGKFVIPGLVDLHHHLGRGDLGKTSEEDRAQILLDLPAWGVTTALDPNLPLDRWEAVAPLVAADAVQFFRTGPSIGAPGGWQGVAVASSGDARRAVQAAAEAGVDAIKVVFDDMTWLGTEKLPMISEETLSAVVDEAGRFDLPVWAHAPQLQLAKQALRLGVSGLVHGIIDEPVDSEFLELLRSREGPYVATLTLYEVYADFPHGVRRQQALDPLGRDRPIYEQLSGSEMEAMWRSWWDRTDLLYKKLPVLRDNLRRVQEAGSLVVTGTDTATPGVITGVSLQLELVLHEEAGLTRSDVLRAATVNAAKALGQEAEWGTVTPGSRADLLVLDGNPLLDLAALRRLRAVVVGGKLRSVETIGHFRPDGPSSENLVVREGGNQ